MKTILLFLLSSLVCFGQSPFGFNSRIMQGNVQVSMPCSTLISSTTGTVDSNNGYGNAANRQYIWWPITNSSAATVCSMDLSIFKTNSPTFNVSIGIYYTTDQLNPTTQIGGDSDPIATSTFSSTSQTNRFLWSSNYPVLPTSATTNYIVVIKCDGWEATNCVRVEFHNPAIVGIQGYGTTSFTGGSTGNRRPYYKLFAQ